MAKEKATSRAAWAMSLAGSILVILTPNLGPDASWAVKLIVTVVGAIGSYAVFETGRQLLMRFYYRRLLGKWYYVSRPRSEQRFRAENFAVMEFKLDGSGDLYYEVTLYPTVQGVVAPGSENPRAHAHSLALAYDLSRGCIDLVFKLEFTQRGCDEEQERKGRLSLKFQENSSWLQGDYTSAIWTGAQKKPALSSGILIAEREVAMLARRAGITLPPASLASAGSVSTG